MALPALIPAGGLIVKGVSAATAAKVAAGAAAAGAGVAVGKAAAGAKAKRAASRAAAASAKAAGAKSGGRYTGRVHSDGTYRVKFEEISKFGGVKERIKKGWKSFKRWFGGHSAALAVPLTLLSGSSVKTNKGSIGVGGYNSVSSEEYGTFVAPKINVDTRSYRKEKYSKKKNNRNVSSKRNAKYSSAKSRSGSSSKRLASTSKKNVASQRGYW